LPKDWGFSFPFVFVDFLLPYLPRCLKSRFDLCRPIHESLYAVEHSIVIGTFASSFVIAVAKLRDTERFFFICVLSALSLIILWI
jgi:hypothetical protein